MRLLTYISNKINALDSDSARERSKRRYETCKKILVRFLGESTDVDVLYLIDESFVSDFGRFLFGRLGVEYSMEYLTDVFKTLRNFARQAIKDGYVPNLDVFPSVFERLSAEMQITNIYDQSETHNKPGIDIESEIEKFLLRVATMRQRGEIRYKNKAVIVYLIGLFMHGLEVEEVMLLEKRTTVAANGEKLTKTIDPRTGMETELGREVLGLASLYNGAAKSDKYLIAAAEKEVAAGCLGKRIENTKKEIAAFLRNSHLGLYARQSVFTDWLSCIIAGGAKPALVGKLVRSRLEGSSDSTAADYLKALKLRDIDKKGYFDKRWHVLVSHASRVRGADMKEQIRKTGSLDVDVRLEAYDPYDEIRTKARGKIVSRNNSAVSNLLFVKTSKPDASVIDKLYDEASLLRKIDNHKEYATVPEAEIHRLILFLKDFRDDVRIVADMDSWLKDADEEIEKGMRVRILNGPFSGNEGTILRVKKTGTGKMHDIFVIQFCQQNFVVEANLSRIEIEPITA